VENEKLCQEKTYWRKKLGARASAILKGVGVHSLSCANLIGEMTISKVLNLVLQSKKNKSFS